MRPAMGTMTTRIARIGKLLWNAVSGLLWPRLCAVCGCTLVEGERSICLNCLVGMPRINISKSGFNPMLDKLTAHGLPLEKATAWFDYSSQSPYAQIIYDLKYHNLPTVGRDAGWIFARQLMQSDAQYFSTVDLLLPVGMPSRKRRKRGYNQTEWIAKGVAQATGIPVGLNIKARNHDSQTRHSAAERRANVKGMYFIHNSHELAGKHVMVIDDVCTTGSTLLAVLEAIHTASPTTLLSVLTLGCTSN